MKAIRPEREPTPKRAAPEVSVDPWSSAQDTLGNQAVDEARRADTGAMAARGAADAGEAMPHGDAVDALLGEGTAAGITAHVGGAATEAALALGASAYTQGDHVVFSGAPDRETAVHEATHVVQQRSGRLPAGGVGRSGDALEQEAEAAAQGQAPPASATGTPGTAVQRDDTTVARGGGAHTVVRGDTLWGIAARTYGHGRYWRHIRDANAGRVFRGGHLIHPGTTLTLPTVQVPTLVAMQGTREDPEALRDLAVAMPDGDYQTFLAGLDADERAANAELLGLVELMRSTGRTLEELADDQRTFLEAEATRQGTTAGELVRQRVEREGYGGGSSAQWDALTPTEQANWERRFRVIVRRLHSEPPEDLRQLIARSEARGGGFVWEPARTETLGAFAYTSGDWSLHCGTRFVEAAESELARVYANIAHEMAGHNVYGDTLGGAIIGDAIDGMSEADQNTANSSGNSVFSAYGYMETEIFAELYEASYDRPDNPTDRPFDTVSRTRPDGTTVTRDPDVRSQLQRIRDAFAPDIAAGIVRSIALRVRLDDFIHDDVKQRFREIVEDMFGGLPAWSNPSASSGP